MPNFELGISNFKPQLTNKKFGGQTLEVRSKIFWFQTMADIKKNKLLTYL
jgi:hypothetical protein